MQSVREFWHWLYGFQSFKRFLKVQAIGGGVVLSAVTWYELQTAEIKFHMLDLVGPYFRLLPPEASHQWGIWALKNGWFPEDYQWEEPRLATTVWGIPFKNCIGLAAGFDKDGEVIEPLMKLGFGFVEIGSITPKPQPGNPKPRVFRLKDLRAIINRYGFNSLGADAAVEKLEQLYMRAAKYPDAKPGVLGINLGKNKTSTNAAQDYNIGVTKLGKFADYLVINISSPNTPGLRALQGRKELEDLVVQVKGTRDRMGSTWGPNGPPPLLIKIAPDLTEVDKMDIAAVVLKHGVDGLIVSNTTIQRPGGAAQYDVAKEAGGLSGPPLFELSTQVLSDMYRLTGGKVPIIGCGGVSSAEDAYKKIRAGASLVQIYTSFAMDGPGVLPRIKIDLDRLLKKKGYSNVSEAVGADHPDIKKGTSTVSSAAKAKKGWLW